MGVAVCLQKVQDCLRGFRTVYRSSGLFIEVQGCLQKVQDCLQKVQDCLQKVQDCLQKVQDCWREISSAITIRSRAGRVNILADLGSFFSLKMQPQEGIRAEHVQQEIRYAAAALLIICAKADFEEQPAELQAISHQLEKTFELEPEQLEELLAFADEDTGTHGLDEFTKRVNQYYLEEDKRLLIESLWCVAFADGRLDRYEEQFIARVAFLIDVIPSIVQQCKEAVSARISQQ